MAADNINTVKHEQARTLTEQALDKLVEGDEQAAGELVEKAKRLDPSGAQEVLDDLDEDAAARGEKPSDQQ